MIIADPGRGKFGPLRAEPSCRCSGLSLSWLLISSLSLTTISI
jgi:hypothetical protein